MIRFAMISAAAVFMAAPAMASTTFTATLEAPKPERERHTAAKAVWVCTEDTCTATLTRKKATVRTCKKVASEVGRVTSFESSNGALTDEEIASCNSVVKS